MPKTITDIIPPSRRRAMEEKMSAVPEYQNTHSTYDTVPPPPPEPSRPSFSMNASFPWRLAIVALLVVVGSIATVYAFSGAQVSVTPTVSTAKVSGDFTATASSGDLPFEIISVEKIGTQSVKSEGTENANDPAQGTITVYNEQAKVQELIKNTRFETSDGLIFRIRESIKIPAGKPGAPGQAQVSAYADVGGEKYNIGPTTFTLPGLKGTPSFKQVYAKSVNPMTGGFSGVRPSVSEKTRDAQSKTIQTSLKKEIESAVAEKIPEGYILIPGALFVSYAPLPNAPGSDNTVTVQQKGTGTAIIFPNEALAKAIAYQALVDNYNGKPVTLTKVSNLTFSSKDGNPPVPGISSYPFTLQGEAVITWVVDPTEIAASVAGKTRQASQTILSGMHQIEKAVLSLKPFWAGTMPQDPAQIKIIIEKPKVK